MKHLLYLAQLRYDMGDISGRVHDLIQENDLAESASEKSKLEIAYAMGYSAGWKLRQNEITKQSYPSTVPGSKQWKDDCDTLERVFDAANDPRARPDFSRRHHSMDSLSIPSF